MSDVIESAVKALKEKLGDDGFEGSVKFEINGVGAVMVDDDGVRADDGDAACTLSADVDTFQAIMDGSLNPTSAFMTGKLAVDGDMGVAMKLGSLLA